MSLLQLTFADGFESASAPTQGTLQASQLQSYASDSAFETAKGSAGADGDAYINTTDNRIHYYAGAWRIGQRKEDFDAWVGTGALSETSFSVANNVAAATNVTGLIFNSANVKSAQVFYSMRRSTATNEVVSTGRLDLVFRDTGSTWDLGDEAFGDDDGVEFSVTAAGQVQYTSDDLTGTGYAGTLRFKAITFDA